MKVLTTKKAMTSFRLQLEKDGGTLGLVPTMGALHEGHLELVRRACSENDTVLVSIFVNPTQFNNPEDLDKYPKNLDADLRKLEGIPCKIHVFAPEVAEMYEEGVKSREFDFNGMDRVMEGSYRPGHFDGVGTIVETLLRLTRPDRAYFGEKDYQQLQIIKRLVSQERIPVSIIACPIVRESDGLAMSSRNQLLTKRLRPKAGFIHQTLLEAKSRFGTESAEKVKDFVRETFASQPDFELEYMEIADAETLEPVLRKDDARTYRGFIAAYLDGVRLIDNIPLN
jgi:pantoate--beta-alanine ligase